MVGSGSSLKSAREWKGGRRAEEQLRALQMDRSYWLEVYAVFFSFTHIQALKYWANQDSPLKHTTIDRKAKLLLLARHLVPQNLASISLGRI